MSEAESQAGSESTAAQRLVDRTLLVEAKRYGVPYAAYVDMSPRERGAVRTRWESQLKAEARRRGLDPEEFVALTDEQREQLRERHPEKEKPRRRRVAEPARTRDEPPAPPAAPAAEVYDPSLTDGDEEEEETDTHSPLDEVPPAEIDPAKRDRATIGVVMPAENEDLVGWKQPRNLRDVYARFTIGDGQHFVRVERVEPKVWHQVPCSGFLGDIREPITEPEFHSWYGGRVYMLTVYGPDPRGRRDPATGMPIIKAKTEPFRYTVPVLPPNIAVPPGTSPTKLGEKDMTQPFQVVMPGAGVPATPADAQMHKSTLDFFSSQLARADAEKEALRRTVLDAGPGKEVLSVVTETNKAALEQARLNAESERRAAEAREKALQDQIARMDAENRRLAEKIDRLAEQPKSSTVSDTVQLIGAVAPGKTAEEALARLRESHTDEMNRLRQGHAEELSRLRQGHDDTVKTLKERHEEERKRLQERCDETERRAKDRADDIERRSREREQELRTQMDQQRRDEREAADRRVKDTETRYEDRIKDIREQHNRELRMQEGQHATRADTSKSAFEMQIVNLKEKVSRLEEELAEAREEASASKDPVQVMAKAKEQAEAMGYSTDKDEPKTGWDRFLTTAGMGLGKAFESIDTWLPKALGAREAAAQQAAQTQRMLPQGSGAPQPQRPQPQRQPGARRATVAWATEGSVPVAGQQPIDVQPVAAGVATIQAQPTPMAQPSAQPVEQAQPAAAAQPVATTAPAAAQSVEQAPTSAPTNGQAAAPNALYGAIFPDEVVVQFRAEVERAIGGGMPPSMFADRFVGQYAEAAAALVQAHRPEQFFEIIKKTPNGMESIVLRRDGKKWVEQLWQAIAAKQTSAQTGAQSS